MLCPLQFIRPVPRRDISEKRWQDVVFALRIIFTPPVVPAIGRPTLKTDKFKACRVLHP